MLVAWKVGWLEGGAPEAAPEPKLGGQTNKHAMFFVVFCRFVLVLFIEKTIIF